MGADLYVAMLLMAAAVVASMVSIEVGISVAIVEIVLGIGLGNTLHLGVPSWLAFLAGLGSVVLTFNAGTEIDPAQLRRTWKASVLIGGTSFAAPFVVVLLICRYVLHWTWQAAQIGGIALSTTSVAVIWAVAVESGLSRTKLGQLLISATFVTDLATVLALSILFVRPTWWLLPFVFGSLLLIIVMRRLEAWFFRRYGERVVEAELKGAFAALLVMMWLGLQANAEAVLPAFVLGFALAPVLARHDQLRSRFRIVSFALLTPFFFLRAGLNVSLTLVVTNLGLVAVLLAVKLAVKTAAAYPLTRRYAREAAWPASLLMSTGLTFGTIASQAGLALGVLDQAQFSILVCVVVLSAVVPTAVAQHQLRHRVDALEPVIEPEFEETDSFAPGDDDETSPHRRSAERPALRPPPPDDAAVPDQKPPGAAI